MDILGITQNIYDYVDKCVFIDDETSLNLITKSHAFKYGEIESEENIKEVFNELDVLTLDALKHLTNKLRLLVICEDSIKPLDDLKPFEVPRSKWDYFLEVVASSLFDPFNDPNYDFKYNLLVSNNEIIALYLLSLSVQN